MTRRPTNPAGNVRRPRTCVLVTVAMLCGGAGAMSDAHAALAHCQPSVGSWVTTTTPPDSSLWLTTIPDSSAVPGVGASGVGIGFDQDPASPKNMFYANRRQFFRTSDGGCSWQLALSLDAVPGTSSTAAQVVAAADQLYSITSVAAASSSQSPNHETVYVAAADTDVNQATFDELPTLFFVSTDGGATFHQPQPLPSPSAPDAPEGTPSCENTTIVVAPSDPRTAYLQCEQMRLVALYFGVVMDVVMNSSPLFVTHDAGQSWTQVSSPLTVAATQPTQSGDLFLQTLPHPSQPEFIVDPRQPDTLWTTQLQTSLVNNTATGQSGGSGLWRSTDSGATWTKVFAVPNTTLAGVDAEYPPSGPERIVTWSQVTNGSSRPRPQAYLSLNGAKTWTTLPLVPVSAIPKVTHAYQAWSTISPFEDVTFAAATNDLLAIMSAQGDYGDPGNYCNHAEAVRYNIKSKRWSPIPTPKEAVADPHGISLAWPVSDHRALATTTYYAASTCSNSPKAPMLLSYTDRTKS